MQARVFITRENKNFKIATLDYRPVDKSLYIFVRSLSGAGGKWGKGKVNGQNFRIDLEDLNEELELDHFSIHGTGVEHTRLKNSKEVLHRSSRTPLRDLDRPRHLWTLVLPDITNLSSEKADRVRDLKFDYPDTMTGGTLTFIATPKNKDIHFTETREENNDRPTIHASGWIVWNVGEYNIFIYSHYSDKHTGSPSRILRLAFSEDYIPIVNFITPSYVEGTIGSLNYLIT